MIALVYMREDPNIFRILVFGTNEMKFRVLTLGTASLQYSKLVCQVTLCYMLHVIFSGIFFKVFSNVFGDVFKIEKADVKE